MNSWFSMSAVGSSMMRLCLCPRAFVKLVGQNSVNCPSCGALIHPTNRPGQDVLVHTFICTAVRVLPVAVLDSRLLSALAAPEPRALIIDLVAPPPPARSSCGSRRKCGRYQPGSHLHRGVCAPPCADRHLA